jgi:quercetin dioxygenase-like cupin family protein
MNESLLTTSCIFDWDQTPSQVVPHGATRRFFNAKTGTLARMSMHATTLNPGQKAHEPHSHPEEEMIVLKEGTLEALHNGQRLSMSAGSILFLAPNDLHGVTNNGSVPATYYVIKWFCNNEGT